MTVDQHVRSYKRRGRVGPQKQAWLDEHLPRYGVPEGGGTLDAATVFGRDAPLVVDIGFGFGEATVAMAAADRDRDVLAVDVHREGAANLLREVDRAGLTNVRVLVGDAVPVLRDRLAAGSLDEVRVFFPDPWPKARHHKRRLVDRAFVSLVATRLRPGGTLHCATDWQSYAEQMLDALRAEPSLAVVGDGYADRPAHRPLTRFERRGLAAGHVVRDLLATRLA